MRQLRKGKTTGWVLWGVVCALADVSKANVKCTPSTPAPARKRRRPNQDLQERLARCEELLKEYATEKPENATPRPSPATTYDDPHAKFQITGKLYRENGSMRFVDNPLIGNIYDEVGTCPHPTAAMPCLLMEPTSSEP